MQNVDCDVKGRSMKPKNQLTQEIDLVDRFDLRGLGVMTLPKNQGYCGAPYAFAAVGSLEAFWNRAKMGIPNIGFSEQQIIDCSPDNNGCYNGKGYWSLIYAKVGEGLVINTRYPYMGR